MSQASLSHAIRRALLAAAVASVAPVAVAQDAPATQDAPTTLDRIEVTGSNIRRSDIETASPV